MRGWADSRERAVDDDAEDDDEDWLGIVEPELELELDDEDEAEVDGTDLRLPFWLALALLTSWLITVLANKEAVPIVTPSAAALSPLPFS